MRFNWSKDAFMETKFVIMSVGFIFCLIASFSILAFLNRSERINARPRLKQILPSFTLIAVFGLSSLATVWIIPEFDDFISPLTHASLLLPIAAALIIALLPQVGSKAWIRYIIITLLTAGLVFCGGPVLKIFGTETPAADKILSMGVWLGITFLFRIINGICALYLIEISSICLGILILSLIGGTPALIGIMALYLTGTALALLAYNWYPPAMQFTNRAMDSFGFLCGFLMLAAAEEGAGSSVLIFALYPLIELLVAIAKKLTFLPRFQDITSNTFYLQTNLSGLNPGLIGKYIIKLNIVMVLFGIFQLFAPNAYSLPVFSAVYALWNLHRLKNWESGSGSLKEINRQFVQEVKSGLNEIKNNLNKNG